MDGPSITEKENYNEGLFKYANIDDGNKEETPAPPKKKKKVTKTKALSDNSSQIVLLDDNNTIEKENTSPPPSQEVEIKNSVQSVVTNQIRQAPNLFQNASFANCNFTFTLPK